MSRNKREVFQQLLDEVRRNQNATARFDQAVADAIGLNRTDMACVDIIQREGPVTAGHLAQETGLTSGAMTVALDRLERSGFARRVRDPTDRRRVVVELTPKVAELERYWSDHQALSERLYERYTVAELELLLGFARQGREFNEAKAVAVEQETRRRRASAKPSASR